MPPAPAGGVLLYRFFENEIAKINSDIKS